MAGQQEAKSETPPNPELDIQKLHSLPSEQQDLYLLTFSSDLARHVFGLDSDGASAHQIFVKKELFKVISLSSPPPTRVIRNNLGNGFAGIFGKGDRKLLFESVNELLVLVSTSKGPKDSITKHAAVHCLGTVLEAAGDSVLTLSSAACSATLKLLKPAQNNAGLRAAIFKALGRIVKGVHRSCEEPTVRDIFKQARTSASNDKALLVQCNACWCLQQIFTSTNFLDNSNDFDKLQSVTWKAMDSPSPTLRRAAAACVSAIYVKNFSKSPQAVIRPKKPKKTKTMKPDAEDGEDPVERSGSPAPQQSVITLSFGLSDILQALSINYSRLTTTNRVRAGIALILIRLFKGLGDTTIEENYHQIAIYFLKDLLNAPSIISNRYRLLITRRFIRIILGELLSLKILGETAQIDAIKFLANAILKDYPQSDVKDRPEPTKETIIATLDLMAILIQGLGSAANNVAEVCRGVILQILEHPSYTVQVHASKCLQEFVLACPQQLLPVITICMNNVNREVRQLTGQRRSPRRCLSFAFGLAAAIATSGRQPLYGSVDVYSRVLSQAIAILKSSSTSDLRVSSTQVQVAWIMIGGLMSLGPSFVKIHLSQFMLLWKNALPKPLSQDNIGQRGMSELSFLTHVRECALGSIYAFLAFNGKLMTVDICTRLAVMLQNSIDFVNGLPSRKTTDDVEKKLSPSLQLQDYDLMTRRRVFQCYTQLLKESPSSCHASLVQSSVLTFAVTSFADPDSLSDQSLSSTIATASGNFEIIWELGDNSGFGVTGLINGLQISTIVEKDTHSSNNFMKKYDSDFLIEQIVRILRPLYIEEFRLTSPRSTHRCVLPKSMTQSNFMQGLILCRKCLYQQVLWMLEFTYSPHLYRFRAREYRKALWSKS